MKRMKVVMMTVETKVLGNQPIRILLGSGVGGASVSSRVLVVTNAVHRPAWVEKFTSEPQRFVT